MSFEESLMRVNNGLNTTLHGVRTAKMASSDTSNLLLLGLGVIIGLMFLKRGE